MLPPAAIRAASAAAAASCWRYMARTNSVYLRVQRMRSEASPWAHSRNVPSWHMASGFQNTCLRGHQDDERHAIQRQHAMGDRHRPRTVPEHSQSVPDCLAYPMPAIMPLHSAVDRFISKNKMHIIMKTQVTLPANAEDSIRTSNLLERRTWTRCAQPDGRPAAFTNVDR